MTTSTTKSDIGWVTDPDGRPTGFEETETETRTENFWHITTVSDMSGPPCKVTVTTQRTAVTSSRSRICNYTAVIEIIKAYAQATAAGILLAAAAFLFVAAATVATGGAALVAAGTVLAAGGSWTFLQATETIKVKKGARTCPVFPNFVIMSTTNIGNPIIETHTVPCGRPITGQNLWILIGDDDGTPSSDWPGVSVDTSGEGISIAVGG